MCRLIAFLCLAGGFLSTGLPTLADEFELPKPTAEHQWLQQLVGDWEIESELTIGPDEPTLKCTSKESVKSIGGFWIVSNLEAEIVGSPMQAVLTLGFDPKTGKYTGTWIDSTGSFMWHYTGTVDETGKKIVLESEGPNPMLAGKLCKFRDITEFKSPDHRTVTGQMQQDDGSWITFSRGDARRKMTAPQPTTPAP